MAWSASFSIFVAGAGKRDSRKVLQTDVRKVIQLRSVETRSSEPRDFEKASRAAFVDMRSQQFVLTHGELLLKWDGGKSKVSHAGGGNHKLQSSNNTTTVSAYKEDRSGGRPETVRTKSMCRYWPQRMPPVDANTTREHQTSFQQAGHVTECCCFYETEFEGSVTTLSAGVLIAR